MQLSPARSPVSSAGAHLLESDLQKTVFKEKKKKGRVVGRRDWQGEGGGRKVYSNALAKTFFCPANLLKEWLHDILQVKTKQNRNFSQIGSKQSRPL